MITPKNRAANLCALLAATCWSSLGLAASIPPPQQDTQSSTGVSYKSGAFSYQARDLSIGSGAFPQALVLERQYQSDLHLDSSRYDGLPTQGWTTI